MPAIDTVIIGAGQAGLAASRLLAEAGHDHVVLEQGRIGERWRSAAWDSLRLLTPNWMTRLPDWTYLGSDPGGYMTAAEVAAFLTDYGGSFGAPVEPHTTVEQVRRGVDRFEVGSSRGTWCASNVVVASGWCDQPAIPPMAARLDPTVEQLVPARYRRPGQLTAGRVLIVGASSTGVQLADELRREGRAVYLAVGDHTRMPRRYRGQDIFWWLEQIGSLDRTVDDMRSAAAAQHEPSPQLIGRADGGALDLATLAARGVVLCGRLTTLDGTSAHFADDLRATMRARRPPPAAGTRSHR